MRRRTFIKSLGLAGAWLGTPALAQGTDKPQDGATILKGKVHAGGTGIAGVAVTDGRTIAVTDRGGRYELAAHPDAEFVYISIPAGYAFPTEKGIARFYAPVAGKTGAVVNDFALEKLGVDDSKHQFVVWADTQMISKKDCEQLKAESVPDLKALVAGYGSSALFHGIGCGDLVWDKFDLFADYKEAIGMTGVPFFNVIGNHDMDISARGDDFSAATFKQQFGPTYYSFNRGAVHYVVLDDVFFIGTAKKYIGYITDTQLAWLEKDLALVKPGSTVVLSVHIPTNTGAARRTGKTDELGGSVSNRKQLYKLLAPFKTHIMSGHTHFNESWEEGNLMEHNHGTVCGAWWTGPICGDGTPGGYGVYEVDGSEIRWYYKSTGQPKEHQLRIYGRGASKEQPNEIVANVWNWDPAWKVEWWEDGQAKGAMQQRTGLDPWAVELYAGPQLPAKHKFVEPTIADHLFVATPAATAQRVTIKATDRFGNVFSQELALQAPGSGLQRTT
ncbi:calcineurin-like phosphoesterase family protein [Flaviaesturariibacter amylovorans]|uniref:Calcineurin-like phosphoesterase family protein n=1 Tax=Flaviaesturariibacter amylovorans TaxID=1084520 RepID=A0ABP8H7I0_9BACT